MFVDEDGPQDKVRFKFSDHHEGFYTTGKLNLYRQVDDTRRIELVGARESHV